MAETLSRFEKSSDSPGFLLWQVQVSWKRKIEKALIPHGLTHIQFVLLAGTGYLTKSTKKITQAQLAQFTKCDVNMTSQVLRTLEKNGLIERIQETGDERAKYPQITKEGLKVLKAAMKDVEDVDENFFSSLQEQLPAFNNLLLKLID